MNKLPQFDRDRNGSLYDRGSADFYYGRPSAPHWWPQGTGKGERVSIQNLSFDEIAEYVAGYRDASDLGFRKEW